MLKSNLQYKNEEEMVEAITRRLKSEGMPDTLAEDAAKKNVERYKKNNSNVQYLFRDDVPPGVSEKGDKDSDEEGKKGEDSENTLDSVKFASPQARAAAEEAGLTAESFKRKRKSSEHGFTKEDVENLVPEDDEDDE